MRVAVSLVLTAVALGLLGALVGCGGEDPPPAAAAESESETTTPPRRELDQSALGLEIQVPAPAGRTPDFDCTQPALPIPRPIACERGEPYPECKWQMPHATLSRGTWRKWRNTFPEHMYGRPGLVSMVVTTAKLFHEAFPEQVLVVGDLDAPGPRHQTHDRGVDVDLYLPGALMVENAGGGRYERNYDGKPEAEVETLRERVLTLARILATCSEGHLRIYYNDEVVRDRFHQWFDEKGYESPFGRPMQGHNQLHDFHFHITFADDVSPLPSEPYAEPPPVEPIAPAPPPEQHPGYEPPAARGGEAPAAPRAAAPVEPSAVAATPSEPSTPPPPPSAPPTTPEPDEAPGD